VEGWKHKGINLWRDPWFQDYNNSFVINRVVIGIEGWCVAYLINPISSS